MNSGIAEVLQKAWQGGFFVQSNFARAFAQEVAAAASIGLITTQLNGRSYGKRWYITKQGLEVYNECYQRDN